MVRRSTPRKKLDESAFPIRVRFAVPRGGLGVRLNDLHRRLRDLAGAGAYAVHSSWGAGSQAVNVYFRDIEHARRLLIEFADIKLADGTENARAALKSRVK